MVPLDFTLSPESCGRLYDALTCLSKFSELVTIEAQSEQLLLTALNSSKSAYVSFSLSKDQFFSTYQFPGRGSYRDDRFACRLLVKALLSVFRGRHVDPRQKENALERCELSVQDRPDQTACRFNIKMIYRHGVTKTYKLTYESVETMHALFDKNRVTNSWKIHAKLLREYIEYFAPKTEQLDIYPEEGRCTLLSFTEKITNGKEILKQPLQTAVSIDTVDFAEFSATENLHIVINVKDFRNMVIHAETLKTIVTAAYSQPSRPLQFSYDGYGMHCEFTLMTIGDSPATTTPSISRATTRERQLKPAQTSLGNEIDRSNTATNATNPNPPNTRIDHSRRLGSRLSGGLTGSRQESDPASLFIANDDDRQWEPVENDEDNEDMLGWDASGKNDMSFHSTFRDGNNANRRNNIATDFEEVSAIAPTQRASQVRGLFD